MEKEDQTTSQKNISLSLDSYDDIFSDFDQREPSIRALSVDFLDEAQRAAVGKKEGLQLNLLLPQTRRNIQTEQIIKRRLKGHFERHHKILLQEKKQTTQRGLALVFIGVIIMMIAAYLLVNFETANFAKFLLILFEPAGWFFFWEGLDIVIFKPKDKKDDLEFYRKLSRAEINFGSY